MLAIEAGTLLTQLARGGEVDLAPGEEVTLAALAAAGLVTPAPDTSEDERELAAARAQLASLPGSAAGPASPLLQPAGAPSEKALRARILELAERTSRAHGATLVRGMSGGPYRAAASGAAPYVLTYKARALLSDLAPRLGRVGRLTLEEFQQHMVILREVLSHRARRAHVLLSLLRARPLPGATEGALRSAAVGLAARNEPERELAACWALLAESLRSADERDGSGRIEWTPDQEAAAAEGMVLATRDLATLSTQSALEVHRQRLELLNTHCTGNPEDALDATMILAGSRREIPEAATLATHARGFGTPLNLTAALVARASRSPNAAELVAQLHRKLGEHGEGEHEAERTTAAVILALAGQDVTAMVQRARDLRAYLARFAPSGMLVPAALLALLPTELAETLDLLRLASAELQKEKFGAGGGESLTLAVKLLIQTALLARGDEGDPEERAGFVRFDQLALAQLGAAGLASQVPLTLQALTAFHRPALDATLYYQQHHQPTHSPYVFSSGRGGSWG